MHELLIKNSGAYYLPVVLGDVVWETDLSFSPGKLTFKLLNTSDLKISEGNPVRFTADGQNVFYGFVFKLTYDADTVDVTAYDQLRYLKNKDTIGYKQKTADAVIRSIAEAYKLRVGSLANTGYLIPKRVEDAQTLSDIIKNALDLTLINTKKYFVFYDSFGALTLKNIDDMKTSLLLDATVASGFTLSSSIDENTYNLVTLYRDNEKTGKRETYTAKDSSKQNEWGILKMYESLDDKENGQAKADALLNLYNQKTQSFSAKQVVGNLSVIPGASLIVMLEMGAVKVSSYRVVSKVKHTFSDGSHFMDLELIGGTP